MAIEFHVTSAHHVFLGEDKLLTLPVWADHAQTIPLDVTGFSLLWVLRKKDNSSDPPLIEKSNQTSPPDIAITGVFNSDPDLNTQKVVITILDTDSYDPTVSPAILLKKRKYRHSLKRMDDGA